MPRTAKPLSAREVATLKKPGTYFDGHGLALRVGPTGAKSWIFRYTGTDGKRHDLGLGPLHTIGLAEARELALACRKQRLGGADPLEARRQANRQSRCRCRQGADVCRGRRGLYRVARGRVARSKGRPAVASVVARSCKPGDRRAPGRRDRHRTCHAMPVADLDDADGNRIACSGSDREHSRLGARRRLPRG